MKWLRTWQGRLLWKWSCVTWRWDRWLEVKRAENHLADCFVIGVSHEEITMAHVRLSEARRRQDGGRHPRRFWQRASEVQDVSGGHNEEGDARSVL